MVKLLPITTKAPSNIQNPFPLLSLLSKGIPTQFALFVVLSSIKLLKEHFKRLQQHATKTLSQMASNSNDDDSTFSILKEPQNEDMCYGLPYTHLD